VVSKSVERTFADHLLPHKNIHIIFPSKHTSHIPQVTCNFYFREKTRAMASQDEVRQIVDNNAVVIFTWKTCPFCVKAKQALQANNIEFLEVLATPEISAALESLTGQGSVPSVWVKGTFIGGCNDGPEDWMGLNPCLRSGKFQELLQG
jgi:glutaredoxin 3